MASIHRTEGTAYPNTAPRPGQCAILVVLGIAFWFAGTLFVRYGGPLGAIEGTGLAITYALLWPVTLPAVLLGRRMAGLAPDQTLTGAAIMTGAAILLDGAALALWPGLYGTDPVLRLNGAAAILWGGGVALALGYLLNRPVRG